jgi:hypothetical protein
MTSNYVVSCFSPPNALTIKSGQTVKVEGWKTGNKIRANSITNITQNGPACNCDMPTAKVEKEVKLAKKIVVNGKASNIQYSSDGVQFDLETLE